MLGILEAARKYSPKVKGHKLEMSLILGMKVMTYRAQTTRLQYVCLQKKLLKKD